MLCRPKTQFNATQRRSLATITKLPTIGAPIQHYRQDVAVAVALARSPVLTRQPTPFEKAYYDYQQRLHIALSNPFPHKFYFQPGSLHEKRFLIEQRRREYRLWRAYPPKRRLMREERELKAADAIVGEEELVLQPRMTASNHKDDKRSLNRLGERTLYLLLRKREQEFYTFPTSNLLFRELLHESARRTLHQLCGPNMDTWTAGRHPISLLDSSAAGTDSVKTFVMKSHIFRGQVRLMSELDNDFLWLSKQEIKQHVAEHYWNSVSGVLSEV